MPQPCGFNGNVVRNFRLRISVALICCRFLDTNGRTRLCVWWALPTAIKAHVVKRPIRWPTRRCPDHKAAYDRNGSPKQDGVFAHGELSTSSGGRLLFGEVMECGAPLRNL
jgi:hypothetical protein